jgi:20S proteasome subunit alpha 6
MKKQRNIDSHSIPSSYTCIASLDELIIHGLHALRDTMQQDKDFNVNSVSIAVVGLKENFSVLEGEQLQPWLNRLDATAATAPGTMEVDQPAAAPMETE